MTYLFDAVGGDIEELTSRIPPENVPLVRTGLGEGGTVVATAGFVESGEELPDGTVNVWWSSPRTHTSAEARLGVGFNSSGISVHALVPDPPLTASPPPSRALIDSLIGAS
jgi:hypothetical protein